MVLVFGEQKCDSRGSFKAKVDAQSGRLVRDQNGGFQGAQKSFKNIANIDMLALGGVSWEVKLV